jgi:hypothetical protein
MALLQRLKPKQHLHGGKSRQSQKDIKADCRPKSSSLITRRKANEGKHCDIAVVDLFAGLRNTQAAEEQEPTSCLLRQPRNGLQMQAALHMHAAPQMQDALHQERSGR